MTALDLPFITRFRNYADTVLRPAAVGTDRTSVPARTIDDLAALGALNHLAPPEYGGAGLDRAADRALHEILAGACFTTWLVWAQHAPLVGRVAPTGALAEKVLRGELLLGAGISDVRRWPTRHLVATRAAGGWTFDGTISWVSGWGLNAALTLAAVDPATENVVTALVPVTDRTTASPLTLAAVDGSRTRRVHVDRVTVPDEDVVSVQTLAEWRHADLGTSCDARPHHFGLAATVLAELAAEPHPRARDVAAAWTPHVDALKARAYALADETAAAGGGSHLLGERLATRVAVGEALGTLTRALLAARSGRGLDVGDTAQLHARNALFALVQGQSAAVRDAQLLSFSIGATP